MIRSHSYRPKIRRAAGQAALLLCLGTCLGGCTTFKPGKLWNNFQPRWKVNEVPYEEASRLEKAGRNVRDGLVGIVDNIFQGALNHLRRENLRRSCDHQSPSSGNWAAVGTG